MQHRTLRRLTPAVAWAALAAAGCGPAGPTAANANDPRPTTPDAAATPPARPREVDLRLVKYAGLAAAVKALKGKVVVVDVWAEY